MLDYFQNSPRPHETEIAVASVVVLSLLIPLQFTWAGHWLFLSVFLFFLWGTIGIPPTTKGEHNCIDIGFRYRLSELKEDLSKTKFEILGLVFVVRPLLIVVETYLQLNEPLPIRSPLLLLVIGPLLEEFYFRGVVQERLEWIIGQRYAIVLVAAVFSFYHWVPGAPLNLALVTRFIRSLFYGMIYAKTRNILTSTIAHFGVNLWGVVLV
ncbi:MAG: CPBP family intramembrane glutamic endopeptidase [Candidatus Thorarchaeota archaeon]|jgi:membrane protease YdiL (CAAX protease family)